MPPHAADSAWDAPLGGRALISPQLPHRDRIRVVTQIAQTLEHVIVELGELGFRDHAVFENPRREVGAIVLQRPTGLPQLSGIVRVEVISASRLHSSFSSFGVRIAGRRASAGSQCA